MTMCGSKRGESFSEAEERLRTYFHNPGAEGAKKYVKEVSGDSAWGYLHVHVLPYVHIFGRDRTCRWSTYLLSTLSVAVASSDPLLSPMLMNAAPRWYPLVPNYVFVCCALLAGRRAKPSMSRTRRSAEGKTRPRPISIDAGRTS